MQELILYLPETAQVQFHFPAARDGLIQRENPLANYVFLSSSLPDTSFLKLENSRLVDMVLCTPGTAGRWRTVTRVNDQELNELLTREEDIKEIYPGNNVSIDEGDYEGLFGTVVELMGDKVKVYVELHSRRKLVDLYRTQVTVMVSSEHA